MFENIDGGTGVIGILLAHLTAFGLGELKYNGRIGSDFLI